MDYDDTHGSAGDEVNPGFHLRLYIAGQSSRSRRAVSNLHDFVKKHLPDATVDVVDIYQEQHCARDANLIVAPTLVRETPPPQRRVLGDLSDEKAVVSGLGITGWNVGE